MSTRLSQCRCARGGIPKPGGECAVCNAKRLQWRTGPKLAPRIVHDVLRSPGRPLEPAVRGEMEARFGHDFSRVRIHTDARAAESARAVDAVAYTVGGDVVFDSGRYSPQTEAGSHLLAHELAHVVQHSAAAAEARVAASEAEGAAPAREREAEAAAQAVTAGARPQVAHRTPAGAIQRAGPAVAAAPAAGLVLLWKCVSGALASAALDAAIQYGMHLWRLRRWPWERAQETWERYRHNWCSTVLSLILGCVGGIVAYRLIEPALRTRYPTLFGATGGTLLGRILLWLAVRGVLAPRMAVKWLARLGCVALFEAEALHPGITAEEGLSETPSAPTPETPETAVA